MPKIKTCPHCNAVLVCKSCGKRYTPELKGRGRLRDLVDVDTIAALQKEAKARGMTVNALLARKVRDAKQHEVPADNRRRRACADPA